APARASVHQSASAAPALPGGAAPGAGDRVAAPAAGNPPPRYPWTARLRGEQGQVVLRVWVSEAGDASRLDVWQSSGSRALDQAALAAVGAWRFEPARRDGRAADSLVHVPVRFRLDGGG
ncbi:MAG: energy transducer TonB, partial [Gammaproteobacteria bacterium]|nr:energy transducer TonB [Gammaproteobacteria bacterium]